MKSKVKSENKKFKSARGLLAKNISGWVLILPSVFLFIMLVWRPICIGISYSFFELKGFTPVRFVGIKNFIDVMTDTNFMQTLWNTLQYVFWSLIIGFPLPIICAIMMNEMVHFKGYFKITTYLPVIIPAIATCMIWKYVYLDNASGLLNMVRGIFGMDARQWLSDKNLVIPLIIISMSWNGFGSTVIMYLANLQSINQELYEAARLDGAGLFGRIRHILIPHMSGTLVLLGIKQVIGIFNITEQPLTMTGGGPNGASMSLGLTNYFYAFKYGQYDKSLALGVSTFLMMLVLTFIYFKVDKKISD